MRILTDEFLKHHGIKGMKWGVRRYQNPDGSLTKAGRERLQYRNNIIRNRPYTDAVNDIVRSMSDTDKKRLGASLNEDWIEKDFEYDTLPNIAKTTLIKNADKPISFVEVWTNGSRTGQIALGTRSGDEYRGKGYASQAMDLMMKWLDQYGSKTMDELEWWARNDNIASRKMAEKYGFEYDAKESSKWDDYSYYKKKLR